MKKFIKYIAATCLGIVSLSSCSDDDVLQLNEANFVTPTLLSTATTAQLSEATQLDTVYTFEWTPASYGISTTINYEIEVTTAEDNFENAQILTATSNTKYAVNGKDLNALLVEKLGLPEEVQTTVKYRIVSFLGTQKSQKLYTEVQSITLTPFPTTLATPWGLVGSATVNGWGGPDVPFWKTDQTGILEAYATLAPNSENSMEFKIRKNNEWVEDMGGTVTATSSTGFSGNLTTGGSNIVVPTAGNYRITINLNNNTFEAELFQWGIVGSATPNSWNGPDAQILSYDGLNKIWYANNVTFTDGEIKFRQNNAWVVDFGGTDGVLAQGGANIAVTAGTYNIIVDFNNLRYTITPAQ